MKRKDVDKSRKLRRNQTDAEKKLWALLRNRQLEGVKFRRQFPLEGYVLDFYSPEYRLGVEADGGGHYENKGRQRDESRTKKLNELGVEIVRFSDRDILTNIEGIYERIKKVIEEKKNNPPHCRNAASRSPYFLKAVRDSFLSPGRLCRNSNISLSPCPRRGWRDLRQWGEGRVRGPAKKHVSYCFYCNPSSSTFSPY